MLFAYVVASRRIVSLAELTQNQWLFLVITGLLLLLFTITSFTAIRHSSVSAVLAIGAAAPIITISIQFLTSGELRLATADLIGLAATFVAVAAIMAVGVRQDRLAATSRA